MNGVTSNVMANKINQFIDPTTASYVLQDLLFSFQCPQTAFAISALRITIFANYIDTTLA